MSIERLDMWAVRALNYRDLEALVRACLPLIPMYYYDRQKV